VEGQIDTGQMMRTYLELAKSLEIEVWGGVEVCKFEQKNPGMLLETEQFQLTVGKVIWATNGYATQLLPELDLRPARNQVLISQPIPQLPFKGTFHYHQGYGYFRNVGNRILIGGFRHLDV